MAFGKNQAPPFGKSGKSGKSGKAGKPMSKGGKKAAPMQRSMMSRSR
jgi:hypothetical protein